MPKVMLGNESVIEAVKKDEGVDASEENLRYKARSDLGKQVTTFTIPPISYLDDGTVDPTGWTVEKQLSFVTSVWPMHSDKPPAWVESDDPQLQGFFASQYGCREGRPKNWKVG